MIIKSLLDLVSISDTTIQMVILNSYNCPLLTLCSERNNNFLPVIHKMLTSTKIQDFK
jgi:hypothetical protein